MADDGIRPGFPSPAQDYLEVAIDLNKELVGDASATFYGRVVGDSMSGEGIVRTVKRNTGLPISLGIAPTKTLAKMASKFAKEYKGYHGACLIDTDKKREKALSLFPIEDIWGIGYRNAKKLKAKGIQ